MSIPSPYPVRFHPQCFPHDPIKIGDPFFITIHHRSRGKKSFNVSPSWKNPFFHITEGLCVEEMSQFFVFFSPAFCLSLSRPYIWRPKTSCDGPVTFKKLVLFFHRRQVSPFVFPLYLSSIFSIHNCAGLAPEFTRCGTIYRGFPNRSVEDS
jgi:hypothetical protein